MWALITSKKPHNPANPILTPARKRTQVTDLRAALKRRLSLNRSELQKNKDMQGKNQYKMRENVETLNLTQV